MDTAADVQRLFDTKADGWSQKYDEGGGLVPRMRRFVAAVDDLLEPDSEVLDFGCGTGVLARRLAEEGYGTTACDFSTEMIARARREDTLGITWTDLPSDWERLPYETGGFDGVVASSVLEYVDDLDGTLSEIARVIRPEGSFLCTVPNIYHPVRRLEGLLATLVNLRPLGALLERIPKVAQYVEYLKVSVNRFSVRMWSRRMARHGLEAVSGRDRSNEYWRGRSDETLALLRFRRSN